MNNKHVSVRVLVIDQSLGVITSLPKGTSNSISPAIAREGMLLIAYSKAICVVGRREQRSLVLPSFSLGITENKLKYASSSIQSQQANWNLGSS